MEAVSQGQSIRLGPRQKLLLAALALERGRPISAQRLTYLLWGDDSPQGASTTVRSHVMRLRRALAAYGCSPIIRSDFGYSLAPDVTQVDAEVFQALVEKGKVQLSDGSTDAGVSNLRSALAMWHGDPLEGIHRHPWVCHYIERFDLARSQARGSYADALIATGRYADAVSELHRYLDTDWSNDKYVQQLALALYRDGRIDEALDACRRGLRAARQKGRGSKLLESLQTNILNETPELDFSPRVRQQVKPFQVPPDTPNFTGRKDELGVLKSIMSQGSDGSSQSTVVISAIAGSGGVGKTALAVHVAHDLAAKFPDAHLYVNLHGYDSKQSLKPQQVIGRFLRALGVADQAIPRDAEEQEGLYRSLLSDKKALIVLDNASSAEQVRPLLPHGRDCGVLVTSRDSLAGLIATDGAHSMRLDILDADEAADLLVNIVGRRAESFDRDLIRRVVRLCGYLPLAIRIAAARLVQRPDLPLDQLHTSLSDERRRLDELEAGDVGVRASFEISYRMLEEPAATLFRRLGVVAGPDFTPQVASVLMGTSLEATRRTLRALTDAHLLEMGSSPDRYKFHDLLRLYARELGLNDGTSRTTCIKKLLAWYLKTAENAVSVVMHCQRLTYDIPDDIRADEFDSNALGLEWLELERPNLAAAIRQASEEGFHERAWQLADVQWGFHYLRKHWADWQDGCRIGLDSAIIKSNSEAESWMHVNLGVCFWDQHHPDLSIDHSSAALTLSRRDGHGICEARALNGISLAFRDKEDFDAALDYVNQALPVRRRVGDKWGEAVSLDNRGFILGHQGRYEEAINSFEVALDIWRSLNDAWGEALSLNDMGRILVEAERHADAAVCLREALVIRRRVGDRWGEGETLHILGRAVLHTEGPDAARRCWQAALQIMVELNAPEAEALRVQLDHL
ncbi:AfsR/SARP family transcriptional regulator [Streptomyces sp. NBC_01236]|uniref:AfsR/SARP family transcriptional regulator n=1 Tax=Streptomyces sp. NBC_01236 TaxID=2903789 RepID=UPI002E1397E3|nr:tetratricopeptide repeat protein [Streptomyces sp. NBC_01236]